MKALCRYLFIFYLLTQTSAGVRAQPSTLRGAVFQKGTTTRLAGAIVINAKTGVKGSTDKLGIFTLVASIGDTLEVKCIGYLDQRYVVKDYSDVMIYLVKSNQLAELNIYGKNLIQDLKEVEDEFRSKGIYYKGRPPLKLLLPFGGSPLTFFYELLSKDGKRARRFNDYAEREIKFYTVASRFTDKLIKNTIPIKDEELPEFKTKFWPEADQIETWNDVDLINYIKKSWVEFKSLRSEE